MTTEPHGSEELLVERGIRAGARAASAYGDDLLDSIGVRIEPRKIRDAIDRAGANVSRETLEAAIYRELLHALMLGALDAGWEAEEERPVEVATFRGPGTSFANLVPDDAIRSFVAREVVTRAEFDSMVEAARRRAFTVARMMSLELIRTVKRELIRQVAVGADLREFRKFARDRLESAGWTPANPSHVETVFRTGVSNAYNGGRLRQQTQPAVLAARPFWQWLGAGDGPPRQRRTHQAAEGIVLPASHPFWERAYPPAGYNCFLPTTRIAGTFTGASRALYAGQAVELTSAVGRRFAVTANHPVATARGIIPAKAVRQGDELLADGVEARVPFLRRRSQRDEHHAPVQAQEVFRALAQSLAIGRTFLGRNDFHGEADRFHGHVDVVGSYCELLHGPVAFASEGSGDDVFEAPLSRSAFLMRSRLELLRTKGHTAPQAGLPRRGALPLHELALGLQRAPLHELRFRATADVDAALHELSLERLAADPELVGELLHRCAGSIALDAVVQVRHFDWLGHVYDFETSSGWIFAEGALVSNCRCRVRSVAASKKPTIGPVPRGLPDRGFTAGRGRVL